MTWPNLQMPESVELEESSYSSTFGRFIVQPLERGFGTTIGNALRRVLLSSLPGAAITMIKVDGVHHEFSTIPGVVEDASEIILNLKEVRFKLINKKPDRVLLELKGPHEFKAGDIQNGTTDFEILNPDHHLATLNKGAELRMELRIGRRFAPRFESGQHRRHLHDEHHKQQHRSSDGSVVRLQLLRRLDVEQHDDEQEQHHHRARIDEHLDGADEIGI